MEVIEKVKFQSLGEEICGGVLLSIVWFPFGKVSFDLDESGQPQEVEACFLNQYALGSIQEDPSHKTQTDGPKDGRYHVKIKDNSSRLDTLRKNLPILVKSNGGPVYVGPLKENFLINFAEK